MPRDLASTSTQGERVLGLEAPVDQMVARGPRALVPLLVVAAPRSGLRGQN